jgi:hypothetical protein
VGFIIFRTLVVVRNVGLLHITMAKQPQRHWCEDISPTLKEITTSKKNGKTITLNGTIYEYVGDNLLFNTKTNKIEKL